MKRNQQYSGQQNSDRQPHQQNPGYSRRNSPSTSFNTEEQFEDWNQDHEYRLEQGSRSNYQNYEAQDYPNYGSEFNSPFGNRRTNNEDQQRGRDYGGQFNRNSEWQNQGGQRNYENRNQGGNYQGNQGYGRNQGTWNEGSRSNEGDQWRPFDNQGNWAEGGRDNRFGRGWDDNRSGGYGQNYPTQSSRYGGSSGYGSSQQGYGGSQGYGSSQQGYSSSQQGYGTSQQGTNKGNGPKGYQRSDTRITEDINDKLTDDDYLNASNIEVTVNGSEVVLKGSVSSREEKRRAEDIAEMVSGVKNVENRLRVSTENSENTKTRDNENGSRSNTSVSSTGAIKSKTS